MRSKEYTVENLEVLKIVFHFVLGPPSRGVPGEGPDYHFPKEIAGVGPIPARTRGFVILLLALSTARLLGSKGPGLGQTLEPGRYTASVLIQVLVRSGQGP